MENVLQKFKIDVYFNLLVIAVQPTEERFQQLSNCNNTLTSYIQYQI